MDTIGTRALCDFPLDLPLDADAAARIRRGLLGAFSWNEVELGEIERGVRHLTSNLVLKRGLTQTLSEHLGEPGRLSPERRADLMRAFYGPAPWRPGDVDLVLTSTALFFCIPKRGTALDVPDWAERTDEERGAIAAFLERLDESNTAETKRFPAFGLLDPAAVDPELVTQLATAVGTNARVVKDTLVTMVSILTTRLVEQYLVHDAWGHTWQEALSEFEWEYALLPKLDDPLGPADGPGFGGPETPTLAEAFVASGGRVVLDEAKLLRSAEADVRGRIQVAVSAALSEMLADFMEAKYTRVHPESGLPTSSLMPSTTLKLDLTLTDVRRQVVRWTRPYRTLAVDPRARADLAVALRAAGLPEAGLAESVERACTAMWHTFEPAFNETIRAEPGPVGAGGLESSVQRRVLLQFVLLAAELERALGWARPGREPAWRDPGACPDLFAITVARFYEQDRQKNFWHLDQVLRTELDPACARLKRALDRD